MDNVLLVRRKHVNRVLIVDDDENTLSVLLGLVQLAGAEEVRGLRSIESLYLLTEEFRPQCIVMDQHLGGKMDGIPVMQGIHARFPWIPVILISGQLDAEMVAEAMNSGADTCLPKPITTRSLELAFAEIDTRIELRLAHNPFRYLEELPSTESVVAMLYEEALRRTKGNQSAAARLLNVSHQAVNKYRKRSDPNIQV